MPESRTEAETTASGQQNEEEVNIVPPEIVEQLWDESWEKYLQTVEKQGYEKRFPGDPSSAKKSCVV